MEAETPSTPTLLMLDEPRVIAIRDGKFTYTFHFRRISQADWERYFAGLYISSRKEGTSQVNTTDVQTAGIELFESTLTKAEGYRNEIKKEDFWKIPLRHSIAASWLLRNVGASDVEDEEPVDSELVEARLDAMWSQPAADTGTTLFKGLIHRFNPPTVEQKKRFLRSGAISRIVGGSRNGTTLYSTRNRVMIDLYDQLIQSVDGYGFSGRRMETMEEIRREMDAYHKVEAVAQIFTAIDSQPAAEAA